MKQWDELTKQLKSMSAAEREAVNKIAADLRRALNNKYGMDDSGRFALELVNAELREGIWN